MWSWTQATESLVPFHESTDKKVKVFFLDTSDNPQHSPVVVKRIECSDDQEIFKAMEEGKIAQSNPHLHICDCLRYVTENNPAGGEFVYVITPKMPTNLAAEIAGKQSSLTSFSEEYLWKLLNQLIAAYAFLQERVIPKQSIAHRDIKPHNILLDDNRNAKVCDFGFAKTIMFSYQELLTLLGTERYFSPVLRTKFISGERNVLKVEHNVYKSDVYSLGVCMLEATILDLPVFLGNLKNLQENITARLNAITDYSDRLVDFLRKMLTVDESGRPDFLTLRAFLDKPWIYSDDQPIPNVEMLEEGSPLTVTIKCGLQQVRVGERCSDDAPCMISLEARKANSAMRSCSMDIVCVIDESGSMQGLKMKLVKDTIRKLVVMMGDRDRMCIVGFATNATRKCPLIACSAENKPQLFAFIDGLRGNNHTNISSGVLLALDIFEQRRYKNTSSSLLLFSDGINDRGPEPLTASLNRYQCGFQNIVTVNTFGFGKSLDSKFLQALADKGKGFFDHIEVEEQIETAFGLAYGSLSTILARNVRVTLNVNRGPVICEILKVFSKDGSDCFQVPDISANQQKDFVFILKPKYTTISNGSKFDAVTAIVTYFDNEKMETEMKVNLNVKIVPWSDVSPPRDAFIFANLYRVKGAASLYDAREFADTGRFQDAFTRLSNGIEELEASDYANISIISKVLKDLKDAKELVQNNHSWERGAASHFACVSYSHLMQTASISAMQYASRPQEIVVGIMKQLPTVEEAYRKEESEASMSSKSLA